MVRMIISDFDGTLFPKGVSKLNDDFITKIRCLTDCGVIFSVNSGRPYHTLREMLKPIENRTVFICNDGAQIMYKNCLLLKTVVDKNQVIPIADLSLNYGVAPFAVLRERTLPVSEDILAEKGLFNEDIYKLVLVRNKTLDEDIAKIKQKADSVGLRVCYEDKMYLELCHTKANKGNATAYIKNRFCIENGVVAFGDGDNDISMFEQADSVYLIKGEKDLYFPGSRVIDNMQNFVVDEM